MLQLNLQQWCSLLVRDLSPNNRSYQVIPYHQSSSNQIDFLLLLILGFFLLCRNEASGIQEHLVLSLKLVIFWQPFAGVNLSLVHSCSQRSKIPRHLRVVLTDSISFNYIHLRHNDNSTANCLNCLNWLNWLGVRKGVSTFLALDRYFVSSIRIPLKNSITNSLPPRSKLSRTHIISLWNVCFTRMILSYFSCFTR